MSQEPYILAIESSCDDTSAAILHGRQVLSNIAANQEIHEKYGGVVPELASRAHQQHIVPVVDQAIQKAGINPSQIAGIAFTRGPGLMGSLLVGTSYAKGLSVGWGVPLIEVNHMRGHILAHLIESSKQANPTFPFICLTVSGGHTQIVKVSDPYTFEILGETIDDAAGEAFDKAAKMLGLPYPGGPHLDRIAQGGDPLKYEFPHPATQKFNFSFSGLKTAFLYQLHKMKEVEIEAEKAHLCASFQHAIVRFLLSKLKKAAAQERITEIAIAGGVSANSYLRSQIEMAGKKAGWKVYIPEFQFCTDNAAMIGIAGYYKWLQKDFCTLEETPEPRMKIHL